MLPLLSWYLPTIFEHFQESKLKFLLMNQMLYPDIFHTWLKWPHHPQWLAQDDTSSSLHNLAKRFLKSHLTSSKFNLNEIILHERATHLICNLLLVIIQRNQSKFSNLPSAEYETWIVFWRLIRFGTTCETNVSNFQILQRGLSMTSWWIHTLLMQ